MDASGDPLPAADTGVALLQGQRSYMEDRAVACTLAPGVTFAAVFDGHVGDASAEFCSSELGLARELTAALASLAPGDGTGAFTLQADAMEAALKTAFNRTNAAFLAKAADDECAGTTAAVVLCVEGTNGSIRLHAANAGDTRAVLRATTSATESLTLQLSRDFKPDDEDETARIEAAGGSIFDMEDGCGGRVVGPDNVSMLQTSRSIGDRLFKAEPPLVPCEPHTHSHSLTKEERVGAFVIVASDGVWDVLSNEMACGVVAKIFEEAEGPQEAAAKLCDVALARGSDDNVAAVVVRLAPEPASEP